MHNAFTLKTLSAQGLHYLLFKTAEQKKACSTLQEQTAPTAAKAPYSQAPRGLQNTARPLSAQQAQPAAAQSGAVQSGSAKLSSVQNRPAAPAAAQPRQATPSSYRRPPLQTEPKQPAKNLQPEHNTENRLRQPVLPFSAWPPAWKHIHKRCNLPAQRPQNLSRQIVWTYAGLEYDLFTDSPSDKRRQLLAQIIKTLSLPKGTHIFLPSRIINAEGRPETAKTVFEGTEYSFFWSAIDFIRPRVLVVFGEQCIQELNLPPLLPTQKHTLMPVTVYALDSIMVYADNPKENEIMMNFLSANFKILA